MSNSSVQLSSYQPDWVDTFQRVAEAINAQSGYLIETIEHIGSTAIPGMTAKPIIDIQCGVNTFDSVDELLSNLRELGFETIDHVKQDHVPFQPHEYFEPGWEKRLCKGHYEGTECNIHIRIVGSANWAFAIRFRDYLRHSSQAAEAYQQVKLRMAELNLDGQQYCYLKDPVCDLIYLLMHDSLSQSSQ